MAMNRLERDEWVAALRSDEFEQGKGWLNNHGRQCCLGVKCILDVRAGRHGIVSHPTSFDSDVVGYGLENGHTQDTMPTQTILEAWGLSNVVADELAGLNDSDENPHSFHQIAQWIEDNVEVVD